MPGVASLPGPYWPRLSKLAGLFLRHLRLALQQGAEPERHSEHRARAGLTKLFDTQVDCERVKTESTGEGKGEIEGKKVLRLVGRCQELTPEEVQQLSDALQR